MNVNYANSFRGNYSFLNLALFTVTFDLYFINLNSCRGNYSREETIQGRKLFAEIRYVVVSYTMSHARLKIKIFRILKLLVYLSLKTNIEVDFELIANCIAINLDSPGIRDHN